MKKIYIKTLNAREFVYTNYASRVLNQNYFIHIYLYARLRPPLDLMSSNLHSEFRYYIPQYCSTSLVVVVAYNVNIENSKVLHRYLSPVPISHEIINFVYYCACVYLEILSGMADAWQKLSAIYILSQKPEQSLLLIPRR